jgi:8-oxo-dGTP pyrophosphatase MutT (NUDIX family)
MNDFKTKPDFKFPVYSAAGFAERARGVSFTDTMHTGDHVLNPDIGVALSCVKLRDAAVLVPVVERAGHTNVILTLRNSALRKHSGQIAFPGGAVDKEDPSAMAAALREADEEIGLNADYVETLTQMPLYLTGSGYSITPVLALVDPQAPLQANPDEVADIFEVPLAFLMNPANHNRESRMMNGRERFYYTMPYQKRFIWGITAGIIRGIYERLYR